MFPVLFSLGAISISSFGVFLALGFLAGIFIVFRLSRAWDLDEEKTLDLMLLTFLGGLIGARFHFAIEHLLVFASSPLKLILFNKAPGFSFWGGFLGGWLTLFFASRRFKKNFWQLSDIALAGLLGGMILSDIGCFLGGCSVGTVTRSFLGVNMSGFIGKRWPVQVFEALLLLFAYLKIWSKATHFHQRGKIVSLGFIYIGMIKSLLLPLKQNRSEVFFAGILLISGIAIYYLISNINPITHLKGGVRFLAGLVRNPALRQKTAQEIRKYWYNQKTGIFWNLRNIKKLLRRSNVKLS